MIALKIKKEKRVSFLSFLFIVIVFFNTVILFVANVYPHYFTIFVPVFILVLSANFTFEPKKIKNLLLYLLSLACVLNVGYSVAASFYASHVVDRQKTAYNSISSTVEIIPEDEKDSVVGFNFPCQYYLYADIVPCFKYYTHQEWWSISDPTIINSFIEYVDSGDVLWLMTLPEEDNTDVLGVISEKYELIEEDLLTTTDGTIKHNSLKLSSVIFSYLMR